MIIYFTNSVNSGTNICPSFNQVTFAFGLASYGHLNETDADVG
jgi:hypothetical protein